MCQPETCFTFITKGGIVTQITVLDLTFSNALRAIFGHFIVKITFIAGKNATLFTQVAVVNLADSVLARACLLIKLEADLAIRINALIVEQKESLSAFVARCRT